MAELKTKVTEQSISTFLAEIPDADTRRDCQIICNLMEEVTHSEGKMWGSAIIGFGDYTYSYSSGRTGDWFMVGLSPRKANISLYIMGCHGEQREELLARLGKHKAGKGCVYIKKLADINFEVLREMCEAAYQTLKQN